MGLLALFALLFGRALVNEVTWPQAIEAESVVSDDSHCSSVGQIIEYSAFIQRMFGIFARHTVFFYAGCISSSFDGLFSGADAWRLLSSSRAAFSPALARKSQNSSKTSKSGTVLECCICHCDSNMVVWSSLSSNIDVTNEAKVSHFITLRARRYCLVTS